MIKNITIAALVAGLIWNSVEIWNLSEQLKAEQEIAQRFQKNALFADVDLVNRIDRVEKALNNTLQ